MSGLLTDAKGKGSPWGKWRDGKGLGSMRRSRVGWKEPAPPLRTWRGDSGGLCLSASFPASRTEVAQPQAPGDPRRDLATTWSFLLVGPEGKVPLSVGDGQAAWPQAVWVQGVGNSQG